MMPADRERVFTDEELCELLLKAETLGFSMKRGSEIEHMTFSDLERMVSVLQ